MISWETKSRRLISRWLPWGLQALLLITSVCVFVPFSPKMPGEGLDASWVFAINQALAQGLAFGRDIIFSFGPYASISTKAYHPATDRLILAGGLYLGISYWIAFFLVTKESRWYFQLLFWIVLAGLAYIEDALLPSYASLALGFPYIQDALLGSYALLAALFCFQLVNAKIVVGDKLAFALTSIVFFPFGLLALINSSLLILCGSMATITLGLLVVHKKWGPASAVAASLSSSILFFWIVSGQSILHLPAFFNSTTAVASGYTEAMAISGSETEIGVYIITALIVLTVIFFEASITPKLRVFLLAVFFIYLFLALKHGFIRHDAHAAIAAASILIAALLFTLTLISRRAPVVLCVSALAWTYIVSQHVAMGTWTEAFFQSINLSYSSAWTGLRGRLAEANWVESNFNDAVRTLKESAKFPLLQGTTDIYSFNQSYLIASGNIWNPRPMLQSLTAYTPSLAEKNKLHLLGTTAPDNVIFKVEPIDGRIPSIEDGASWPVLLTHYQPTAFENEFLYLHKRKPEAPDLEPLGNGICVFGDAVAVPNVTTIIFVEIEITPSIIGTMANILFKPTELRISLNLENGTSKTYRIIAEMAKSGFIISPLIENTAEFGLLYAGKNHLTAKGVTSFSITPVSGGILWKDSYRIAFKQIVMPPTVHDSKRYKFDSLRVQQSDNN